MPFYISQGERNGVEELASRIDAFVPDNISLPMWSLPILEKMVDRIEELEKRIKVLEVV